MYTIKLHTKERSVFDGGQSRDKGSAVTVIRKSKDKRAKASGKTKENSRANPAARS